MISSIHSFKKHINFMYYKVKSRRLLVYGKAATLLSLCELQYPRKLNILRYSMDKYVAAFTGDDKTNCIKYIIFISTL